MLKAMSRKELTAYADSNLDRMLKDMASGMARRIVESAKPLSRKEKLLLIDLSEGEIQREYTIQEERTRIQDIADASIKEVWDGSWDSAVTMAEYFGKSPVSRALGKHYYSLTYWQRKLKKAA